MLYDVLCVKGEEKEIVAMQFAGAFYQGREFSLEGAFVADVVGHLDELFNVGGKYIAENMAKYPQ